MFILLSVRSGSNVSKCLLTIVIFHLVTIFDVDYLSAASFDSGANTAADMLIKPNRVNYSHVDVFKKSNEKNYPNNFPPVYKHM